MTSIKNYLKLLNHPSKILPILNYTLLILYGTILFQLPVSLTALFLVIFAINFAWIFSVGINDYYDIEIDKVINPNRPLVSGDLTKKDVKGFYLFFVIMAMIFSFICSLLSTFWIIILVGIYLLLGILYSTPPMRIKMRTSLSTIVIGLSCFITILSGGALILLTENFTLIPIDNTELIFASSTIGIIAFIVSLAKDLKDIPGDKAAGIPTLPIKYGPKKTAKILLIFGLISFSVFLIYPIFDNIYFLSYPFIMFGMASWIIVFIYYIMEPGKERAETLYKFGFMGFLIIILSFIILKIFF